MRRPPPLLATIALLLLLPLTLAQLSKTNYTISDASPILKWDPPNLSVTQAQMAQWTPYPPPNCLSQFSCHNSTTPGSSVSITFTGTGAWFLVSGPGEVTVEVDTNSTLKRSVTVPAGGGTFGIWDLRYQGHTLKLTVEAGVISVVQAVVESAVGGPGASSLSHDVKAVNEDGSMNPALKLTLGDDRAWYPYTPCAAGTNCTLFCSTGAAGGTCTHSGLMLSTNTSGATLQFSSPRNTSLISIIGSVGSAIGLYNVQISPPPYFGPNSWDGLSGYSTTFGVMTDNVLWFVSVDPTVVYTIVVTFVGGPVGSHWDFWGAQFLITSGVPIGAVAGGIAGGLVVIIALAILIWRVRKREKAARTLLAHFTVDNSPPDTSPDDPQQPMTQVVRNNSSGIDLLSNHGRNRSSVDTTPLSPSSLAPLTDNAHGRDAVITPLVLTSRGRSGSDLPIKRTRSSKADLANMRWSQGTSLTFSAEDAAELGRAGSEQALGSPRSSIVESTSMPPTVSVRQSVQVVQQDESKQPRHQSARVHDPDSYEQEEDAGRVGGSRPVPPRYDPSWASDLEYGGLTMEGLRTAVEPNAGAPLRAHNPDGPA
ncbi:hypothetical protein Q8F55_001564 [Vanrija albida]|uniref:Uncharacterized protein n=1 Tax=Vanrija albida TaxID=181172 RepID=A0ABR3QH18_9TREE